VVACSGAVSVLVRMNEGAWYHVETASSWLVVVAAELDDAFPVAASQYVPASLPVSA